MTKTRQERLAWFEERIQAVHDGHIAQQALAKRLPKAGAWLSVPVARWAPDTLHAGHSPQPCDWDIHTGIVTSARPVTGHWTCGDLTGTEAITPTAVMPKERLIRHLETLVAAADTAMAEVIKSTSEHRTQAARNSCANVSYRIGRNDGFVLALSQVELVADRLADIVIEQVRRFAGVPRFDTRGKQLNGRPTTDIHKVLTSYIRARARRFTAREAGVPESWMNSGQVAAVPDDVKNGAIPLQIATSVTDINDVVAQQMPDGPTRGISDTRRARAAEMLELIESAGGVAQAAADVISGKNNMNRLRRALLAPWPALTPAGGARQLKVLATDPNATDAWCAAYYFHLSNGGASAATFAASA